MQTTLEPAVRFDNKTQESLFQFALETLNVDLVGVANIERFENAPPQMSPQGIMPDARSVVVLALHHPDGCIEMGGITHPQDIGPYTVQYLMNSRLDEISYQTALFLEDHGYRAVPIVSSNIWRYKGYKNLKEHFAPDVSHMHAAVAAGLAEFGYNGLAITPEFGARQRYVTIITDALFEPSELMAPGTVCDNCMLCVKNCLSGALSKELNGFNEVVIEDKTYKYVNKNLWRCAWGEHFDLDLDLEIPEVVNEEVILENVRKYGLRRGEFGSCLRYCLPKDKRYFDRAYTNAPRRRKHNQPGDMPLERPVFQRLKMLGLKHGMDFVLPVGEAELEKMGIDLKPYLPDARSAILTGVHFDDPGEADERQWVWRHLSCLAAYDICRELERLGYSSVTQTAVPTEAFVAHLENILPGRVVKLEVVPTSARILQSDLRLPKIPEPSEMSPREIKDRLATVLSNGGATVFGASPSSRLDAVAEQLKPVLGDETRLKAVDKSERFRPYDPVVTLENCPIKSPANYLPDAQSVLVFGVRLPKASVEVTARGPAEAVGPYSYVQYHSVFYLHYIAFRAIRLLQDMGYKAELSFDLLNTASFVGNPRGDQPDAFSNRFAAMAAGLGRITKGGFVVTPEHGTHMRFAAIVTDAELTPDSVIPDGEIELLETCKTCDRCISACLTNAFGEEVTVEIDGVRDTFRRIDRNRCDWAKRHSLVADEGNKYIGWMLDEPAPEEITPEILADALRKQPAIPKVRPCNFERCVLSCPASRPQE